MNEHSAIIISLTAALPPVTRPQRRPWNRVCASRAVSPTPTSREAAKT
jgi:hypothetical protein